MTNLSHQQFILPIYLVQDLEYLAWYIKVQSMAYLS